MKKEIMHDNDFILKMTTNIQEDIVKLMEKYHTNVPRVLIKLQEAYQMLEITPSIFKSWLEDIQYNNDEKRMQLIDLRKQALDGNRSFATIEEEIHQFMEDRMARVPFRGCNTELADVWEGYKKWAEKEMGFYYINQNVFTRRLAKVVRKIYGQPQRFGKIDGRNILKKWIFIPD